MSTRRRNPRRLAGAAVFLWIMGDRPFSSALPDAVPSPLTAAAAPSCPLPVGQQVKAVKAFREMLPVFRHPRCSNCHGGVDPHSEQHRGSGSLDEDLTLAGNRAEYLEQCQTCHNEMPGANQGWMVPPIEALNFVGKSDEKLCLQMKHFEKTGEKFVAHIFNDHGEANVQFIAAAYVGDRALGAEELKAQGLKSQPPPGRQAELTEQARKWTAILGKGYESSPECGCVMPKIKLRMKHTELLEVPGGVPSKESSEASFEVDLRAVNDLGTVYAGQHSLKREIRMTLPKMCTAKAHRDERWDFRARIDTATGRITVSRNSFADQAVGEIVCRNSRGTARTGVYPNPAVSQLGFGDLVFPPDSGSSKTLTSNQGIKETLTMTLLEVPGK